MSIYVICLLVGGTFVLFSALGGLDGVEFGDDTDDIFGDFGFGTHTDSDSPERGRGIRATSRRLWLPIFSLRFWTFGSCFFGLSGLLVSLVRPDLAAWVVAAIALALGTTCGIAAAWTLRSLGNSKANSLVGSDDVTGLIGTVEIPFEANSRGKISLSIKGSTVSFMAFTEEERAFNRGDRVLVVGRQKNQLWVVSPDALNPSQSS